MNGFNLSNIQNAMLGSTQVSALYYGSKLIWENYNDYSIEYFTIEPTTSDGADVLITKATQDQSVNLSYSTDLINWTSVTINTYGANYTLLDHIFYGDKMYIKGINNALGVVGGNGFRIYAIEPYKVYGNVMSLLYGDNFANQTTLTDSYSFSSLFNNSNNGLTDASNLILPATTLTGYCYSKMFQNCKQLTKAPALPATTLANYCYYNMFLGCTSLTSAPILPATTLAENCYYQMFRNCTSLMYIKTLATDISANNSHYNFTSGVNTTGGTFVKNYNTQWPTGTDGIPSGWNVSYIYNVNIDNTIQNGTITSNIAYALPNETVILTVTPDPHYTLQSLTIVDANDNPVTVTNNQFTMPNSNVTVSALFNVNYNEMYLTIESQAANNRISWKAYNSSYPANISYSTDLINWTSKRSTTYGTTLATLGNGDILYLKGSIIGLGPNRQNYFTSSGKFKVYGNIMSLTNGDNFVSATSLGSDYQLQKLFYNNSYLTDASNLVLPAKTLTPCCYYEMFRGCGSLVSAPQLPATTLSNSCYASMFRSCTSLTTVPELPATTLQTYCYSFMFYDCSSLNSIKCLATNISGSGCLNNWLSNVASSGTFYKDASMTLFPEGASGIPSGWTVVDV